MTDLEAAWSDLVSGRSREWWSPAALGGLSLLAAAYGGVVSAYRAGFDLGLLRSRRLPCRVISVGNLTMGGTGKTTTVRWLARRLLAWGVRPAVLSYGYRPGGRRGKEPVTVVADAGGLRAPVETGGDEPVLLARSLPGVPVLAGKQRVRSGQRAWEEFAVDACILDDGFQYWRLEKDAEIVLLSATNPFGGGRIFPRGMLRESPRALRRASAAVITHAAWADAEEREALRARLRERHPALVVAAARHVPVGLRDHETGEPVPLASLREGRWLAMSGLGQPESFERTLADLGAVDALRIRFGDHHPYAEEDLRGVRERARSAGLRGIVTTEKDGVKIPPGWLGGFPCRVLEIDLQLMDGRAELEGLLRERLGLPRGGAAGAAGGTGE